MVGGWLDRKPNINVQVQQVFQADNIAIVRSFYYPVGIGISILMNKSFSVSASVGWANIPSRIAV